MLVQPSIWVIAAAIVGATTGLVSLGLLIFSVGRRIGELEGKLKKLEDDAVGQREWGELGNKVETLYRTYVMEALKERNGDNDSQKRAKRKGR